MDACRPAHRLRRALALGGVVLALAAPVLAYDTGQTVTPFTGTDAQGKTHSLAAHKGKTVVLFVWGSQCFVSKRYASQIAKLEKTFSSAVWLGVAPHAGESAAGVLKAKAAQGLSFPILVDAGGVIAKSLNAEMTPSVFVIGPGGKMRYQGAISDKPAKPKKTYLADALRALAAGQSPAVSKTKVRGFRIQY